MSVGDFNLIRALGCRNYIMLPVNLTKVIGSRDAAVIYAYLCKCGFDYGPQFYTSMTKISDRLLMRQRTIRRARDLLERKGLVQARYDRLQHRMYWSLLEEEGLERVQKELRLLDDADRAIGKKAYSPEGGTDETPDDRAIGENTHSPIGQSAHSYNRKVDPPIREKREKERENEEYSASRRPPPIRPSRPPSMERTKFSSNGTGPTFEDFCKVYPDRPGRTQGTPQAKVYWKQLTKPKTAENPRGGWDPQLLVSKANYYRLCCEENQLESGSILQQATFLGPKKQSFKEDWEEKYKALRANGDNGGRRGDRRTGELRPPEYEVNNEDVD